MQWCVTPGVEGLFSPLWGLRAESCQGCCPGFVHFFRSAFGAADYFAANISILLLDRIPRLLDPSCENEARRFINLIDILYETNKILISSVAAPPDISQREDLAEESDVGTLEDEGLRVIGEGGSFGRSLLMIGSMEWSATGRHDASLANPTGASLTRKTAPRAVSRLLEMQSDSYVARARSVQLKAQVGELAIANMRNRCQI